MADRRNRSRFLTILLLCIICAVTLFFLRKNIKYIPHSDRQRMLLHISNLIKYKNDGKLAIEGQACRVPVLDVNASEILSLLKTAPKVVCNSSRDWVEIKGSTAKIASWAKEKYGEIECSFTDIIRENDHKQHQGITTTTHTEYNLENSDVITAFCKAKDTVWQKVFMGVRFDQDIFDRSSWAKLPNNSLRLNFLMLGFDSMSHNMWKRKLPKTYKYATKDLKGIALNGYNIVGDGTPQALIPILTGRTELELPDVRKRMGRKAQYVNVYPFIWNNFLNGGYVTAYSEDLPSIGTFTHRMKGFTKQPVDHYMRTFYKQAEPYFYKDKTLCYGGLSRFKIMINFIEDLYEVYKDKPKFIFAFSGEYSHDSNDFVGNADDEAVSWLQDFNKKGYFNNTVLVLMSDHGSRFAAFRNTQQGKMEERLPGFIFVFPPWFSKKYPEEYGNFVKNAERLTTPFDVHETIKNILHFEGSGKGDIKNRGISLFKEIPLSRTCQDAGIEPHWCTCLKWDTLPVDSKIIIEAVEQLLNFVNSYTLKHRNLCSKLRVGKILWSAKLLPNDYVLKFKKNSDYDGFVGDLSASTVISEEIYQFKVSFEPGNMIFEASVAYYTAEKKFIVSEKAISRVNKYRDMTKCIEDKGPLRYLGKFCYCL